MARLVRLDKVNGLVGDFLFGPVRSRRFGSSLGVNPLPPDLKLCTFDCPYCECGRTSRFRSQRLDRQPFPTVKAVLEATEEALELLAGENIAVDSLTLTGNGETTLHPAFDEIVAGLVEIRDRLLPKARLVVLTNGTRLGVESVFRALQRVDLCAVKIDAGTEETFRKINRPIENITLDEIAAAAARLPRVTVQSLFVRGRVDNTGEAEIAAWIEQIERIAPHSVQVFSIERPTAEKGLTVVPHGDLEGIAALLTRRTRLTVGVY